jgi:hypothetical protein
MNHYVTFPIVREENKLAGIEESTSNYPKVHFSMTAPDVNFYGKIIHIMCPLIYLYQPTDSTISCIFGWGKIQYHFILIKSDPSTKPHQCTSLIYQRRMEEIS